MIAIVKEGDFFILSWNGVFWKKIEKHLISKFCLQELEKVRCLSEAEICLSDLEDKRAKQYAIWLLSRQSLFASQVKEKMHKRGFCARSIAYACNFCEKIGAIDDSSLAKVQCEREIKRGKGLFFAKQKLGKWVDSEEPLLPQEQICLLEKEAIYKVLAKKRIEYCLLSLEEKRKVFAFLLKRGFQKESIQEVLSSFMNGSS